MPALFSSAAIAPREIAGNFPLSTVAPVAAGQLTAGPPSKREAGRRRHFAVSTHIADVKAASAGFLRGSSFFGGLVFSAARPVRQTASAAPQTSVPIIRQEGEDREGQTGNAAEGAEQAPPAPVYRRSRRYYEEQQRQRAARAYRATGTERRYRTAPATPQKQSRFTIRAPSPAAPAPSPGPARPPTRLSLPLKFMPKAAEPAPAAPAPAPAQLQQPKVFQAVDAAPKPPLPKSFGFFAGLGVVGRVVAFLVPFVLGFLFSRLVSILRPPKPPRRPEGGGTMKRGSNRDLHLGRYAPEAAKTQGPATTKWTPSLYDLRMKKLPTPSDEQIAAARERRARWRSATGDKAQVPFQPPASDPPASEPRGPPQ